MLCGLCGCSRTAPQANLERVLRGNYIAVSEGEVITFEADGMKHAVIVEEVQPHGLGVSVVDTDCAVDFAPMSGDTHDFSAAVGGAGGAAPQEPTVLTLSAPAAAGCVVGVLQCRRSALMCKLIMSSLAAMLTTISTCTTSWSFLQMWPPALSSSRSP